MRMQDAKLKLKKKSTSINTMKWQIKCQNSEISTKFYRQWYFCVCVFFSAGMF